MKKNTAKNQDRKKKTNQSFSQEFDIWIDKQDVMLEFHVSERTLYNLRKRNILPFARLGKKIIFNRSLIEQMLKNGLQR